MRRVAAPKIFGESSLLGMNYRQYPRWGMLHTAAEGESATKDNTEGGRVLGMVAWGSGGGGGGGGWEVGRELVSWVPNPKFLPK